VGAYVSPDDCTITSPIFMCAAHNAADRTAAVHALMSQRTLLCAVCQIGTVSHRFLSMTAVLRIHDTSAPRSLRATVAHAPEAFKT
jgi:hypothetical protein